MSWHSFRPYVSVAERRRKAESAAKKMASKSGRVLAPVHLSSRVIAGTFWGKAWCDNLESYSDYSNRLPRGRTYVRNGSVIDLQISTGQVRALVQGSELYKIAIDFRALPEKHWQAFKSRCSGKIANLLDLLQGRLSKEILADITARGTGLFPEPKEIELDCSCPDWADMCKHVAAVLYGVGARLDDQPDLFFTLRGVDMQELISAASVTATTPMAQSGAPDSALAGEDLSQMFGVEIEAAPAASAVKVPRSRKVAVAAKGEKGPKVKKADAKGSNAKKAVAKGSASPTPAARTSKTLSVRTVVGKPKASPRGGRGTKAKS